MYIWRLLNSRDFGPPPSPGQYHIHATSLPFIRIWLTPSLPLSADVICTSPLGGWRTGGPTRRHSPMSPTTPVRRCCCPRKANTEDYRGPLLDVIGSPNIGHQVHDNLHPWLKDWTRQKMHCEFYSYLKPLQDYYSILKKADMIYLSRSMGN